MFNDSAGGQDLTQNMENDIRKHVMSVQFTLGLFITSTTQDAEERS